MNTQQYVFQKYDVLQVCRDERWQDFATIRDESDARMAVALVNKTHAELSYGKSFAELRNLPMRIRRTSEDRTVFGP